MFKRLCSEGNGTEAWDLYGIHYFLTEIVGFRSPASCAISCGGLWVEQGFLRELCFILVWVSNPAWGWHVFGGAAAFSMLHQGKRGHPVHGHLGGDEPLSRCFSLVS